MAERQTSIKELVVDAVDSLGGTATHRQIIEWITARRPDAKHATIRCQITALCVNHNCRIHYSEICRPRVVDRNDGYDRLYRTDRGVVERYDPGRHGTWEVYKNEDGRPAIRAALQVDIAPISTSELADRASDSFALEAHLRDYLAKHLDRVEQGLDLYIDDDGSGGVEFRTDIGIIDILCTDQDDGFLVIELKVSRGPDDVAGQVLRYVNWVRRHIANGRRVRGLIIARSISEKILYSIESDPLVSAREYELAFSLGEGKRL